MKKITDRDEEIIKHNTLNDYMKGKSYYSLTVLNYGLATSLMIVGNYNCDKFDHSLDATASGNSEDFESNYVINNEYYKTLRLELVKKKNDVLSKVRDIKSSLKNIKKDIDELGMTLEDFLELKA